MKKFSITAAVSLTALLFAGGGSAETIIGDEVGNGNFEVDAFAENTVSYKEVSHWHLIGGNESSTKFGTSSGTNGSPDPAAEGRSDRQGAFFFDPDADSDGDRYAANDTGYTVAAAGETFDVSMSIHKFGRADNYSGDEVIRVVLFTVAKNLNTSTDVDDMTILGSTDLKIQGMWSPAKAEAFYTTTAEDVGKTIYLGLELIDPSAPDAGKAIYPRIDAVVLDVNQNNEPN